MRQLIELDREKDSFLLSSLKKWIGHTNRDDRTTEADLSEKENIVIEEFYNIL